MNDTVFAVGLLTLRLVRAQETLAQRNSMLEKVMSMQQTAASQTPAPASTRSSIEVQKDAWWLDARMKVRRRIPTAHYAPMGAAVEISAFHCH